MLGALAATHPPTRRCAGSLGTPAHLGELAAAGVRHVFGLEAQQVRHGAARAHGFHERVALLTLQGRGKEGRGGRGQ